MTVILPNPGDPSGQSSLRARLVWALLQVNACWTYIDWLRYSGSEKSAATYLLVHYNIDLNSLFSFTFENTVKSRVLVLKRRTTKKLHHVKFAKEKMKRNIINMI